MCSEVASPRISFSYYLPGDGTLPIEYLRRDITLLDSKLEFEFNISSSMEQESSSADELFSNGIILPIKPESHKQDFLSKQAMKEIKLVNVTRCCSDELAEERDTELKGCRGSKRSSSLNFESKRTSLCHLPLVSRSNSTGSEQISKSRKCKDSQKQQQQSTSMRKLSLNQYPTNLKPKICKNSGGAYGNYHYISPVLNVSPKFFAFGSLLLCGFDRKAKK